MVKLGNHLSDKNNAKTVSEDGYDTIPLITPLDASQLQFPVLDKVVVKTKTDYDGEHKKSKLHSPKIAAFSISIIEGVSERLKVTLLVICALAFLVCVMFLVVYKVYQYEQPCTYGFMYTVSYYTRSVHADGAIQLLPPWWSRASLHHHQPLHGQADHHPVRVPVDDRHVRGEGHPAGDRDPPEAGLIHWAVFREVKR
ncbi:neuronal vesicle trafficking-associated protein 1 isoform X1 [Oncorhynchus nerka]|uniref:neuronal vesicle trafficking-associated protein 1 isoform X1 n=1 Tax=Oncorhynchus nerka TaxID=8023 RepID=UPI00112FF06D|nr:neuronal vesicle trafficking-associated protein 1 isoform X1 [Oncorhynchus nerka]